MRRLPTYLREAALHGDEQYIHHIRREIDEYVFRRQQELMMNTNPFAAAGITSGTNSLLGRKAKMLVVDDVIGDEQARRSKLLLLL